MKKKFKLKKLLIFVVIVGVIAAGAYYYFNHHASTSSLEVTYVETEATMGSISNNISSTGTLAPADSYSISTLITGDVLADYFDEGDIVEYEQLLYMVDSEDTETTIEKAEIVLEAAIRKYDTALENLENLNIYSDTYGTVTELNVKVGDSVSANTTVATVVNKTQLEITVQFLQDEALEFYVGQTGSLILENTFEEIQGTITEISKLDIILTTNQVVREVTFVVDNPGALAEHHSAGAVVGDNYSINNANFEYIETSDIKAEVAGEVIAVYTYKGETVYNNELIIVMENDDLDDALDTADDSVRDAQLSYDTALDTLDDYNITSPIAGTVIQKDVKYGDTISERTQSSLCTIYDLSYLQLTLNIDELDILGMQVGLTVLIESDSFPDEVFVGEVTYVSLVGATSMGVTSYPITVKLYDYGSLMSGMNVSVTIITSSADEAVMAPISALQRDNTMLITATSPSAVNAVDTKEAPEGYVYVNVTTGLSDGSNIEITSGLVEGDIVAVASYSDPDHESEMSSMFGSTGSTGMTSMDPGMSSGMSSGGMSSGGMSSSGPGMR